MLRSILCLAVVMGGLSLGDASTAQAGPVHKAIHAKIRETHEGCLAKVMHKHKMKGPHQGRHGHGGGGCPDCN